VSKVVARRRWSGAAASFSAPARPREVVQTSAMDCGPASPAALLSAHGLSASLAALRDVCATDVDGTSIDALEEVAVGLGVRAEQVVVPFAQVFAAPELYLPAIVLTERADGYLHFVVVWRVHRGRLDVMDPAVGRRRPRLAQFAGEAFLHELTAPLEAWSDYALGDDARIALHRRLRAAELSEAAARERLERAAAAGPVAGIGELLGELEPERPRPVEQVPSVIGEPMVRVRGAVLIRAPALTGEPVRVQLRHVLEPPEGTIGAEAWAVLGEHRRALAAAAVLMVLAGAAAVGEVVAASGSLEHGARGGALTPLLLLVGAAMIASAGSVATALAVGRSIEYRLRDRLAGRVRLLGDQFVRSRPVGDLAERGHAIALARTGMGLLAVAGGRIAMGCIATAAMVAICPATWPAAVVLLFIALVPAWLFARRLGEHDLRARTAHGAIALRIMDSLNAGRAISAHRGEPVLDELNAPLLNVWEAAVHAVQRRQAQSVLLVDLVGLTASAVAVALAARAGAGYGRALVIAVLGFTATGGSLEMQSIARRAVLLRNAFIRMLEPMTLPARDPPPAPCDGHARGGVAIEFADVAVRLGTADVLAGVTLRIDPGEHVAVVGTSGAGKSSLIALLAGWLAPHRGTLLADRRPLHGEQLARLRAATALVDSATEIFEDSLIANAAYGSDPTAATAAARLAEVGLPGVPPGDAGQGRRFLQASSLTPGELDRLRLARALGRPAARLVLLDEALGRAAAADRWPLVAHARDAWAHATLVYVTHDLAESTRFPRVLVLDDGRVVQDGAPEQLLADADGPYARLLEAQAALQERVSSRPPPPVPADPPAGAPRQDCPFVELLRAPGVRPAFAAALAAAMLASVGLVLAGNRLGAGATRHDLGWLPMALLFLAATATLTAIASRSAGRAMARYGRQLRLRALAGAIAARPATVGYRIARVLDLEQFESVALASGVLLAIAATEMLVAFVLLVAIHRVELAAVLLLSTAISTFTMRRLVAGGQLAADARTTATATLAERLLAIRTITIQEDPDAELAARTQMLTGVRAAHRAVDHVRVLMATVLPRATVLAMLAILVIDPPATRGALAGALGATLLAFSALDQLEVALADLGPGIASARSASSLLGVLPPLPARDALVVPAPEPGHVIHQPLMANAALGLGHWPPTREELRHIEQHLDALGLGPLLARMPLGLGQPIGETGWRLSHGERVRLIVVRALMTNASTIFLPELMPALDPENATKLLDHLDTQAASVHLRKAAGAPLDPVPFANFSGPAPPHRPLLLLREAERQPTGGRLAAS
jgi:ABC-type multidrug transport system fused ATPase/permease subunit